MIKIDQAKASALVAKKRITELQALLAASDYKVMPDYDKPNDDVRARRQMWREEIRALEQAVIRNQ